jgi:hypothetical protein
MRRSFLLSTAALAGALALGCTDQPTPTGPPGDPALSPPALERQTVEHFTFREPFEEDVISPCTGEVVHFTGELFEQQTHLEGDIHVEQNVVLSGTGTGTVTGTTYSGRQAFHLSFNSPSVEAGNFTLTVETTLRAITAGPNENFIIHFRLHITALPSGEFATEVEVESAECRG